MAHRPGGGSLREEGRALVERLGGRWTDRGGLCHCPAHDDRTPSLSVRLGRTRLLFHCFAGCDADAILRALAGAGLHGSAGASADGEPDASAEADWLKSAALRLWGAARPIPNTVAERYLAARALQTSSPELRYLWRTPMGPKPLTQFRPAMIAAVRDETGIIAVHRTFIDPRRARLAPVQSAKLALGALGGGAVRLGGGAARLGLAEGIETALSASMLFDLPCWATLGTERFRHVALPTQVLELLLFLDNDAAGRRAEALAREANPHIASIEAHYPQRAGADWNDVLWARGRKRCAVE
jgi:hypothetical protein